MRDDRRKDVDNEIERYARSIERMSNDERRNFLWDFRKSIDRRERSTIDRLSRFHLENHNEFEFHCSN